MRKNIFLMFMVAIMLLVSAPTVQAAEHHGQVSNNPVDRLFEIFNEMQSKDSVGRQSEVPLIFRSSQSSCYYLNGYPVDHMSFISRFDFRSWRCGNYFIYDGWLLFQARNGKFYRALELPKFDPTICNNEALLRLGFTPAGC